MSCGVTVGESLQLLCFELVSGDPFLQANMGCLEGSGNLVSTSLELELGLVKQPGVIGLADSILYV